MKAQQHCNHQRKEPHNHTAYNLYHKVPDPEQGGLIWIGVMKTCVDQRISDP
jgi:hypothetical protein